MQSSATVVKPRTYFRDPTRFAGASKQKHQALSLMPRPKNPRDELAARPTHFCSKLLPLRSHIGEHVAPPAPLLQTQTDPSGKLAPPCFLFLTKMLRRFSMTHKKQQVVTDNSSPSKPRMKRPHCNTKFQGLQRQLQYRS